MKDFHPLPLDIFPALPDAGYPKAIFTTSVKEAIENTDGIPQNPAASVTVQDPLEEGGIELKVDFFTDEDGVVHPIRGSSGYDAHYHDKTPESGSAPKPKEGAKPEPSKVDKSEWKPGSSGAPMPTYDDLMKMDKVPGPLGSNGGEWRQDANGTKYLMKPAKSDTHAYNEVAAGAVYHVAGIKVPNTEVVHSPAGKAYVVSQKIEGLKQLGASEWHADPDFQAKAAKGFGIDALLSNWDVNGLDADNTFKDENGDPVRIDAGGAMAFRGMGGPKPSFDVGEDWVEPQSMRTSPQGKVMYGKMTDEQAADSLEDAAKLDTSKVRQAWASLGVPKSLATKWIETIRDRKQQIPDIVAKLRGTNTSKAAAGGSNKVPGLPEYPKVQGDRTDEYLKRDLHAEGDWGPKSPNDRYGVIMFNDKGQVMLREPKGHFDGYHWTFSKGHPDGDEHPVTTALRENAEETGKMAGIVGHVPGGFGGTSTGSKNYYYLGEDSGADHPELENGETANVKWASPAEAVKLIGQSTNTAGRDRDLATLKAATAAWKALNKKVWSFRVQVKYDPDQPRDDHGRWGDGGSPFSGKPGGRAGFVTKAALVKTQAQAMEKIKADPHPTQEDVERDRREIAGAHRAGGELRGNSHDRHARTAALLKEFGDGEHCPCVYCGRKLDASTLTQDKIYTASQGGRYRLPNLLPACLSCNQHRNDAPLVA